MGCRGVEKSWRCGGPRAEDKPAYLLSTAARTAEKGKDRGQWRKRGSSSRPPFPVLPQVTRGPGGFSVPPPRVNSCSFFSLSLSILRAARAGSFGSVVGEACGPRRGPGTGTTRHSREHRILASGSGCVGPHPGSSAQLRCVVVVWSEIHFRTNGFDALAVLVHCGRKIFVHYQLDSL
jgi:hypothetical protein